MFLRTESKVDAPERENMDLGRPPHDFEFGWATKHDAQPGDDTVPAMACGDIRAFTLPDA